MQVSPAAAAHDTVFTGVPSPKFNTTDPSGVKPVPSVGVTVAVTVMARPWSMGFCDETIAVVVL